MVDIDETGQVVGFSHHDGRLEQVRVASGECELTVISAGGERHTLTISGTKWVTLTNFLPGNILDRIFFWAREAAPSLVIEKAQDFAAGAGYKLLLEEDGSTMGVLVVDCSYGASLVAFVDGTDVQDILKVFKHPPT
jgi:hypothetical protein